MVSRTGKLRASVWLAVAAVGLLGLAGPASSQPSAPAGESGSPLPLAGEGLGVRASSPELASSSPASSGPREFLALLGVDQSHFDNLTDNVPWQEGEDEILLKMLYRLGDFRPEEIEGWARDDFFQAIAPPGGPADVRGEIFRLRGRVVLVDPIQLADDLAERYEMREYYRCRLRLDDGRAAIVFTQTIPSQWKRGQPIDEPAGALGFFLKLAGDDPGQSEPVFVAWRIAWYPDTRLGNLGMDVGLLDDLQPRRTDASPEASPAGMKLRDMQLTTRNRECFYQMLAAAGRAKPGELIREAKEDLAARKAERFSVVPLFNTPGSEHGRLAMLSGTAREVVMVRVADEDVRARFGIDHYYQISLFTEDSQGNPLVFCVRELPPGMPTGKGPQFRAEVTAAGFFFNTWAYRSQAAGEGADPAPRWQLAPLLIGRDVIWHPQEQASRGPWFGAIAAGGLVLLLLAAWLLLWRYSRSDKQFHDRTLIKHVAGEPPVPLDQIGIDISEKPDFSGLDRPAQEP